MNSFNNNTNSSYQNYTGHSTSKLSNNKNESAKYIAVNPSSKQLKRHISPQLQNNYPNNTNISKNCFNNSAPSNNLISELRNMNKNNKDVEEINANVITISREKTIKGNYDTQKARDFFVKEHATELSQPFKMGSREDSSNYKGRFFIENKVIQESTKNFKTSRPNIIHSDTKNIQNTQRIGNSMQNLKNIPSSIKTKSLTSGKLYNSTKLR